MKISYSMWETLVLGVKDQEISPAWVAKTLRKLAVMDNIKLSDNDDDFDFNVKERLEPIVHKLMGIDLGKNPELKDKFFKIWKEINHNIKNGFIKEIIKVKKDLPAKEMQKFYLQNILEHPTIEELYGIRKKINQKDIKSAVLKIYKDQNFREYNPNEEKGLKRDYWSSMMRHETDAKLLDLIEMAGFTKEELEPLIGIGFRFTIIQEKFDRFVSRHIKKDVVEIQAKIAYVLEVKVDKLELSKTEKNISDKNILELYRYVNDIIIKAAGDDIKLVSEKSSIKPPLVFMTYDKDAYEKAQKNTSDVINWINNNTSKVIEMEARKKNPESSYRTQAEDIKNMVEKIIEKERYETLLVKDNKKVIKSNKI